MRGTIANQHSLNWRYYLSYSAIFGKLKAMVPSVRDSNWRLLQSEICLDTEFDNFKLFVKKFKEITAATSIHATCHLAKRSIPLIPCIGSVFSNDSMEYNIMAIYNIQLIVCCCV